MKLPIFEALQLRDTGERRINHKPLKHISVKQDWEPNIGLYLRYALEAKFRATVSIKQDAPKIEAVEMATKQIAHELFGPLPDMAYRAMYCVHDGDEVGALDELRRMLTLMDGQAI